MQNNIDLEELKELKLYEHFSELSNEELKEMMEEINEYIEEGNIYEHLKKIIERIENERIREIFYWRLYYLIDEEDKLTKLGKYYELLYTHHYIRALRLYFSLSNAIQEKNKVFTKNEKAKEYLKHFEHYVKKKRVD